MDVSTLLNQVGSAVSDAKAKADTVEKLKADLASVTATKQAKIDEAQQAYTDAKVAADRLQAQARELIETILPSPDPRFRVSQ